MDKKVCTICKQELLLELYHKDKSQKDGHAHRCKKCVSRRKKIPTDRKTCTKCKCEKPLSDFNKRKHGRLGVTGMCKVCINEYAEKWREKTVERRRELIKIWNKQQRNNNPLFRLRCNVRCRVYEFLKGRKINKRNKTFELIGCDVKQLKEHLECLFQPGMTWDNYGKWHIDHIIPLSSALTEDDILGLCHYSNLQPLWGIDNMKKGNKIYNETKNKGSDY